MRSGEVVKALPFVEFGSQVDVALVVEQLVEFLLIGSMRTFDFAVQLRRATLDVGVANALVLDMPMELRLEFMTIVGSDLSNAEWEGLDDVVHKVDSACLGVFFINLKRPYAGCIIDGGKLEAADFLPFPPWNVRNLTSIWMW